jgi:hypothetical protein
MRDCQDKNMGEKEKTKNERAKEKGNVKKKGIPTRLHRTRIIKMHHSLWYGNKISYLQEMPP